MLTSRSIARVVGVVLCATAVDALASYPDRRSVLGGVVGLGVVPPANAAVGPAKRLSDGVSFPLVSFGLQIYDDERARKYTLTALECGYRNFFASVLAGNQRGFGRAIRESGIPREDIFVCGSVLSNRARGFDAALRATARGCDENVAALGVGPLDMIMLDYPGPDAESIRGQWQGLEEMKKAGGVRSLAVSNFSPQQLDVVIKDDGKPSVNQLPFGVGYKPETNRRLLEENTKRGVFVQAWSPLRVVGPTAKAECAQVGQAYGKSPQQVALKWILQKGASFTTQTTSKAHFLENIDIFDFTLSDADVARLDAAS
ncbi:hypothetical protein CTAYLR_004757 [Chrysophaeum taylorii]|uniref:NADP-dependent oxidoreductase domain-containing protein n=1 Tax=Chrysophaeum taylorii TaxID=2483200 RepID=A0AAD7U9W5_9STRA|nr:hypothetical protein CTAYLR_004757 [Chrysophaeum taylorii]